jgi:hypothetical protein
MLIQKMSWEGGGGREMNKECESMEHSNMSNNLPWIGSLKDIYFIKKLCLVLKMLLVRHTTLKGSRSYEKAQKGIESNCLSHFL